MTLFPAVKLQVTPWFYNHPEVSHVLFLCTISASWPWLCVSFTRCWCCSEQPNDLIFHPQFEDISSSVCLSHPSCCLWHSADILLLSAASRYLCVCVVAWLFRSKHLKQQSVFVCLLSTMQSSVCWMFSWTWASFFSVFICLLPNSPTSTNKQEV